MNNKIILLTVILLAFALTALAQTSDKFEVTLKDKGYSSFVLDGKNKEQCSTFTFLNQNLGSEFYPIVSLNLVFSPTHQGTAEVQTKLNGTEISQVKASDLTCTDDSACTLRIWTDQNLIQAENNLEVCLTTTDSIAKVTLLDSSVIGLYKTPIVHTADFNQSTQKSKYFVGEDIPIIIQVYNSGSKELVSDINFARPVAEEYLHDLTITGDTYYSNVHVLPGETKTFSYTARIDSKQDLIGFVPAALKYTSIFGELQELKSNYMLLQIVENIDVHAGLLVNQAIVPVNGKTIIKAVIQNNSTQPLFDLKFELKSDNPSLKLDRNAAVQIARLNVGEEKEISFEVSSDQIENYSLNCTIQSGEKTLASCETVVLSFREDKTGLLAVQGLAVGLLAIGIIAFLWSRK